MKSIFYKSILFATLAFTLFSGCANDDNYDAPSAECTEPNLTANKTVQQIIAQATATPQEYTEDDVIEAYVTSSDEKGTFFKSISLQTLPTDGTAPVGFSISINANSLYGEGYVPGRKVYIKLRGLYFGILYNSLVIGAPYQDTPTSPITVGRISENVYRNSIFVSCTKVDESDLVRTLPLSQVYNNANLNTLVEIDAVRFVDASLGRTYFDLDSGGGATNHYITAAAGGTSQIIRFSSFAPFAGNPVQTGIGKIRGVLTKYNSDFQFIVRYESDIKLTQERTFSYPSTFTENFESYAANQNNFPNYFNDPITGTKVWNIKTTASKYLEMSAFGTPAENNRTLFFVPVNMTDANTMTFKYKVSFPVAGHMPLKVYYTTNYTPGQNVATAGLVDITSSFNVGTATTFTSAGTYTIPASVTGNGFFVFEYTGSGLVTPRTTTNFGIDDIIIN